jgi:glycosyltransferase involved in cell wall biosynthesis
MTNLKILVSIIIPVYNLENEIARCLDSCIAQSYTNIEIIVIDDGSKDNSALVIQEFTDKDNRIVYHYKKNEGLPFARKSGMLLAKGDYFFHLDGDDYIPEDAILSLVNKSRNAYYDIIIGNYYQKLVNSNHIKKVRNNNVCSTHPETIANAMILGSVSWSFCFKLIKREFYINAGIEVPNISLGEDGIAMLQLLSKKPKVIFTDDYVYFYINRPDSMGKKSNFNIFEKRLESFNYIRNIILNKYAFAKYVLLVYDIRFHTNNYEYITPKTLVNQNMAVFTKRLSSAHYRFLLLLLSKINKTSLKLYNGFIHKLPSFFLYFKDCILRFRRK